MLTEGQAGVHRGSLPHGEPEARRSPEAPGCNNACPRVSSTNGSPCTGPARSPARPGVPTFPGMNEVDVLITGGGASGTLLAAQLLRQARTPLRVLWVDRTGGFTRGLAYGAAEPCHLLNVPAANMSGLAESPGHLLAWREREHGSVEPGEFLPRLDYGRYLAALLEEACAGAAPGVRLERLRAEVVGLRELEGGAQGGWVEAELASGERLRARLGVLAPGNSAPEPPRVPDGGAFGTGRYVATPWRPAALDRLPRGAPLLLLGTGLTMVDVVLSLRARGHTGPLHALSRHGLLPQVHAPPAPRPGLPPLTALPEGRSLRTLVRAFREEVERAGPDGWRPVLDGLRPRTAALWQGLSREDRRRFLRHVRAYWETHRHRLPPQVAGLLQALQAQGQLRVEAGRLVRVAPLEDGLRITWRPRGERTERSLDVAALINCTGPATDVRRLDTPLLGQLLEAGLARADAYGLGLETRAGALVGTGGRPSPRLFALGPLRRAELWESTAIPEIRVQARALASTLLRTLGAEHETADPKDAAAP